MPDGLTHLKLHNKFQFTAYAGVLAIGVARGDWVQAVAVLPGYYLGKYIDPDMDLPNTNTVAKQLLSETAFFFWLVPWFRIYGLIIQHLFGGHHSIASHFPVLSTGGRFVWLMLPAIVIMLGFLPVSTAWILQQPWIFSIVTGLFWGLCISDSVHIAADAIYAM